MRHIAIRILLAGAVLGFTSLAASAQTIIDLSTPQTGKSRFVLNSDLTPANLGVVAEERAATVGAAPSRVPACGDGCRMIQPVVVNQPEPAAARFVAGPRMSTEAARAYAVSNARNIQSATDKAETPRRKFRGRRR